VGFSGPATISGVDFEVCSGIAIHVDGTGTVGRPAGPITVTGSFLEAGGVCIQATNAVVIAQGNRIRSTPLAFKAIGANARIYDFANVIEASVVKLSEGNVITDTFATGERTEKTRAPWNFDTAVKTSYAQEVYSYSYDESLATGFKNYKAQLADAGTQRMLTSSEWVTREMRAGSVFGSLGLVLDYSAGLKTIVPYTAGDTEFGTSAKPFASVKTKSITQCAGVGVGVNPSAIGELVLQFTSNTVATIKAMGSDGVVRSGNITLS
jgi:hypothetical protein